MTVKLCLIALDLMGPLENWLMRRKFLDWVGAPECPYAQGLRESINGISKQSVEFWQFFYFMVVQLGYNQSDNSKKSKLLKRIIKIK